MCSKGHAHETNGQKTFSALSSVYLPIVIITVIIISSMGHVFYEGHIMTVLHTALIDAAMEIKLEATIGHHILEEILYGVRHDNMDEVWEHYDAAEWYAKAMLQGVESPEGKLIPLDDAMLRSEISNIQNKLIDFRKITLERMQAKKADRIDTEIEQKYHLLFNDVIQQSDIVETELQQAINKQLRSVKRLQTALIIVCVLLAGIVAVYFHRFILQQMRDKLHLQATNQQLNATNQQLNASKQHLRITNQQLIASKQQLKAYNNQLVSAEQKLSDSDEKFRVSLKGSKITTFTQDRDLKYTWMYNPNPSLTVDYVLGKTDEELIPPEDALTLMEIKKRVLKSGKSEHQVIRFTVENQPSFYSVNIEPMYDKTGSIIGIVGSSADITEIRKIEQCLHETRNYLENLMNYANAPIIVWDPDLKITLFNHAFEHLTDISADEAIGRKLNMLFPEQSRTQSLFEIKRTLTGEYWQSVEIPILQKGGNVKIALWNSANIYAEDGTTLVATIAQGVDITERKQVEKEREQLIKELKSKNEDLQSIVYISLHDLKTPLVNIKGFSNQLIEHLKKLQNIIENERMGVEVKKEITSLIDEDIHQDLDFISTSTARMKGLIDGLARVSRIGAVEINIKVIDMNKMISEVFEIVKYQTDENETDINIDDLPNCKADENMIKLVFTNLVDNAIKYFKPNQKGSINITGHMEDGRSIYCVEDNGIGIKDGHQAKIFEIYHRLDPKGPAEGEGLGLTIIKRILDRHNADIWLESEENKGSKFFVSLPQGKNK